MPSEYQNETDVSQRKIEEIWRFECHQSTGIKRKFLRGRTKRSGSLSTNTDSRRVKVVDCHQRTGMKRKFLRGRTKRSGKEKR